MLNFYNINTLSLVEKWKTTVDKLQVSFLGSRQKSRIENMISMWKTL